MKGLNSFYPCALLLVSCVGSVGASETSDYVERVLPNETAAHYRPFPCDYLEVAASSADSLLASTLPEGKRLGSARKVAVGLVRMEKSCPSTTLLLGGRLGLSLDDVDPLKAPRLGIPSAGVWINEALPGSTGAQAGVMARDVIVALNDMPVDGTIALRTMVGRAPVGSSVKLKIWREQRWLELNATVGPPLPGTPVAAAPTTPAPAGNATADASATLLGMPVDTISGPMAVAIGLPQAAAARVLSVSTGSGAEKAGLKALDVILDIGGQEVSSASDLNAITERMRPGYKATLTVWRYRAKKTLQVVLNPAH